MTKPNKAVPQTVHDFVVEKLAGLPDAARLAVVFDPYGHLDLGAELPGSPTRRGDTPQWRVYRYDGNDLAFRKDYCPGPRDLIWVTCPPGWARQTLPHIELHSLMDVWRRAEIFIDASLPGVLAELAPDEVWPVESVWEHAGILSQNLPTVVAGRHELRRHLDREASLDAHAVRALGLHALQPNIPIERFLFREDTAAGVLGAYVDLLWEGQWEANGLSLLQTQARQAHRFDLGDMAAWFEVAPSQLAVYIYLRYVLGRYQVPHIANQVRGLGLFDIDVGRLEPWVGVALTRWVRAPEWRQRVIAEAESELQPEDLSRIVSLLSLETPDETFEALVRADTPALLYALGSRFFQTALEARTVSRFSRYWLEHRPVALDSLPETGYKERARVLAGLLDEIGAVHTGLDQPIPETVDLVTLLEWYTGNRHYDLEYALARATNQLEYLPDPELRSAFSQHLQPLRRKVREYLDRADHVLAACITGDWSGYMTHPRLAINVLRDTVNRRRLKPTTAACLWVVIFDGMRWDTWERWVKPCLLERFELLEQAKPYLSLLPSWTAVARTGMLAGKTPGMWQSYDNRWTKDEAQLAARLFDLPARDWRQRLQFYSGVESDRQYNQLKAGERYPYNVLIFNLSDDNLHKERGNLVALNQTVNQLLDHIFQVLDNLVQPADTIVVASDHGFMELDDGDATEIADDPRWQRHGGYPDVGSHPVHYRYLITHDLPDNLTDVYRLEYPRSRDQYTVAIGKRWFRRANTRGSTARYDHGGLSFAEMVIPGAVLRRITERAIELKLDAQPERISLREGESATVVAAVTNTGNVRADAQLEIKADTATEPVSYRFGLAPGETHKASYTFEAIYRVRSDKTEEMTTRVDLILCYTDLAGGSRSKRGRVTVEVTKRTDVVELDFGGLPDLD